MLGRVDDSLTTTEGLSDQAASCERPEDLRSC